jgi:hypothetical protein
MLLILLYLFYREMLNSLLVLKFLVVFYYIVEDEQLKGSDPFKIFRASRSRAIQNY